MPLSQLKRPIRGRLGRLLASLRPPSRPGPLPVQTGFPTSLADLLVKNHDRLLLNKPKRCRPTPPTTAAPSPPTPPVAAAVEPLPQPTRRELSPEKGEVGVAFRLRPELLAVGAAAALVMLLIWSRRLVAALTVASLSLLWIETVRSSSSSRRPRRRHPAAAELPDLRGRNAVSPIREVESEAAAATPRSSCSAVSVSSLWTDDERSQLDGGGGGGGGGESTTNSTKRKEKRKWLKKLLAKKKKLPPPPPKEKNSSHGEVTPPDAGEVAVNADAVGEEAIAEQKQQPPSEDGRRGCALPFAAFAAVILVGLVGGKLPAVALTVLFTVFFSSVERRDQKLSSSDELI